VVGGDEMAWKSVVQVAEARVGDDGEYELRLPASLE
jgi:hypothetical protein